MRHAFFDRLHLRIIDVLDRDHTYGASVRYSLQNRQTQIRSFLYAYDGEGAMELNGVSYPLAAGSVFHFPLQHHLLIRFSQERPLCYYTIRYDYKLIDWEGTAVRCSDPDDRSLPFDYVVPMTDKETMLRSMQQLHRLWHAQQTGYEWEAKLAFMNMLQHVGEQQRRLEEHTGASRAILQCMDYIRNHYDEPLDRERLAKQTSFSTSYFSVLFKKQTGYSPVQYITKIRLDRAKWLLLREKHLSIGDVARAVGFQDPQYFTKVFAHEIGVPPSDYKKM